MADRGRRRLVVATLVVLIVIAANFASGGTLSSGARDISTPLWRAGAAIGGAIGGSGFFSSKRALEAQVAELQAQVNEMQVQAAAFAIVQQQNETLSQMAHLEKASPGIAAPVVSSLSSSPYGTFLIGAGSGEGVAKGSLVLAENGFVVGVVAQVQSHQSLVDEIFGPGAQTPVVVDGADTMAQGKGGDAEAGVPHGISVSVGDAVIAPGYGGRPIGTVAHVDSNPASAESTLSIALPVSLSSLQLVYVTP